MVALSSILRRRKILNVIKQRCMNEELAPQKNEGRSKKHHHPFENVTIVSCSLLYRLPLYTWASVCHRRALLSSLDIFLIRHCSHASVLTRGTTITAFLGPHRTGQTYCGRIADVHVYFIFLRRGTL